MTTDGTSGTSLSGLQRPFTWGKTGVSSPARAFSLPVGTVTFLLTDVEGSTRLWSSEPADVVRTAIARHYELLCSAVEAHGGVRPQEQGEGDSIVAAFERPSAALRAAQAAQLALAAEPWPTISPIKVRMAIHTGEAQLRDDANYAGQAIIRTARLRAVAHGGQLLVSGATHDLATDQSAGEFQFLALGEHLLRDLGRAEQVWQLVHPDLQREFPPLRSMDSAPQNLPVSLSPFIGRVRDVQTVARLVAGERLVTVTGSGGSGKTRLAQQVGAEVLDEFDAGVWWVDLAPLGTAGVHDAVRTALGISNTSPLPLEEAVRRKLDGQASLMIVDNCEHVVDDVAPLVDRLLRQCPSLHVLATSRGALELPGELTWRVPPLSMPDPNADATVESISQFDAARLFCDRAQRARPSFQLSDDNARAVADVCRQLDGVPLAIELAAARCRSLSPAQVLDGLHDMFRLLTGGPRTTLPRQQTLEASVRWSHERLTGTERVLFRRLGTFVDGWTLDAAEAVCADDELDTLAVFDALDRLVSHSLVQADETPHGTRFRMLETIRQFARRELHAAGDESSTRDAHARWYAQWLEDRRPAFETVDLEVVLPSILGEQENLLAAFQHLVDTEDHLRAIRWLETQLLLHSASGYLAIAQRMLQAVGTLESHFDQRGRFIWLVGSCQVAICRGEMARSLELSLEAEQLASKAGDTAAAAGMRACSLMLFGVTGEPVVGQLLELSNLAQHAQSPFFHWGPWVWAAWVAALQGRLTECREVIAHRPPALRDATMSCSADVNLRCALGTMALLEGRPSVALDIMLTITRSNTTDFGTRMASTPIAAAAAADLGIDLPADVAAFLESAARVDGVEMAVHCLRIVRAIEGIARGDLDGAHELLESALQSLAGGVTGHFVDQLYVLFALDAVEFDPDAFPADRSIHFDAAMHRIRAETARRSGALSTAADHVHAALSIEVDQEMWKPALFSLECLARILVAAGQHQEAVRLIGACDAERAARSLRRPPGLQRLLSDSLATAQGALGVEQVDAALREGATLDLASAVDFARRHRVPHAAGVAGWAALTPAELRVVELVAQGKSNPEVAAVLLMSPETVKTHMKRVFTKLAIRNRQELVLEVARRG